MKRVSAVTITHEDGFPVIHGSGECPEFIYDIVKGEIVKMNNRYKKELAVVTAERDSARMSRDGLRTRDRAELLARLEENPSPWVRFINGIENVWCVSFATLIELGLIKHGRSGKQNI